jgi:DNA-binding LytR/AlgR family response regulator
VRVRIQHVEEKKQEEALLRLTGEDVCSAGLKEYIETDSWRMVSLSCRKGGEIHRVKSSDIFYVESVQEVQLIHAEGDVLETRERLYVLEKMLPSSFLRISRSVILNLDRVKRYRPLINGLMEVKLENGELVYISRKYLREVRDRILDSRNEGGISDDKEKHQE